MNDDRPELTGHAGAEHGRAERRSQQPASREDRHERPERRRARARSRAATRTHRARASWSTIPTRDAEDERDSPAGAAARDRSARHLLLHDLEAGEEEQQREPEVLEEEEIRVGVAQPSTSGPIAIPSTISTTTVGRITLRCSRGQEGGDARGGEHEHERVEIGRLRSHRRKHAARAPGMRRTRCCQRPTDAVGFARGSCARADRGVPLRSRSGPAAEGHARPADDLARRPEVVRAPARADVVAARHPRAPHRLPLPGGRARPGPPLGDPAAARHDRRLRAAARLLPDEAARRPPRGDRRRRDHRRARALRLLRRSGGRQPERVELAVGDHDRAARRRLRPADRRRRAAAGSRRRRPSTAPSRESCSASRPR